MHNVNGVQNIKTVYKDCFEINDYIIKMKWCTDICSQEKIGLRGWKKLQVDLYLTGQTLNQNFL